MKQNNNEIDWKGESPYCPDCGACDEEGCCLEKCYVIGDNLVIRYKDGETGYDVSPTQDWEEEFEKKFCIALYSEYPRDFEFRVGIVDIVPQVKSFISQTITKEREKLCAEILLIFPLIELIIILMDIIKQNEI